jgi:hypothetical protein
MSKPKLPRLAGTYRAARRNQVFRTDHGVWSAASEVAAYHRPEITIRYVPSQARGSAALRKDGKAFPQHRVPPYTYPTNGPREVARRMRKAA